MSQASVLYDAPGPRARLRNNVLTIASVLVLIVVAYVVVGKFRDQGQLRWELWEPFVRRDVWVHQIIPGLLGTLRATAVAAVLALAFGVVFGLGRVSEHWWVRVPAGAVVEFFRAIPVLIMIFFVQAGPPAIYTAFDRTIDTPSAFTAVVVGLTLYNGSVLAEIFRAGIRAVPRGQSEAAYSIGLRKTGAMRLVMLPQATTAMMPAIVSQLVVLLKDSALGWIVAYEDLLNAGLRTISANFGNIVPAAIAVTVMYILINLAFGRLATILERRNARRGRTTVAVPRGIQQGAVGTPGIRN